MNNELFPCWHAELMVLGFISLLLTFGQNYISKMCIPAKYARTMLPCLPLEERHGGAPATEHGAQTEEGGGGGGEAEGGGHHRRLLSYERRFLAAEGGGQSCNPVINSSQLNVLTFFVCLLPEPNKIIMGVENSLFKLHTLVKKL